MEVSAIFSDYKEWRNDAVPYKEFKGCKDEEAFIDCVRDFLKNEFTAVDHVIVRQLIEIIYGGPDAEPPKPGYDQSLKDHLQGMFDANDLVTYEPNQHGGFGRFTIFTDGPDIEDIVNKVVKENPLLHRKEMVLYIGLRTFGRHAGPPDFASVERALHEKFQDCVVQKNTTLLR